MEGLAVSHTALFTGCVKTGKGTSEVESLSSEMRAKRKGVVGEEQEDIVMDTFNRERMSLPSKGTGHWGITKKEWEKGRWLPWTQQVKGEVF